jgi:uncharacterized protein (DUF952 family)
MCTLIYHITERVSWQEAQARGEYRAPSLDTQGFIHLSTREQVAKVANAIYKGQEGLVVLVVLVEKLQAELRFEPPDTKVPAAHYEGELFPHLYGVLNIDAVREVIDFRPDEQGLFAF